MTIKENSSMTVHEKFTCSVLTNM